MSDLAPLMSSANPNWQTPPEFLNVVRELAGGQIELDPCTTEDNPTGARSILTPTEDGLSVPWPREGLVYANPPYGRSLPPWAAKFAAEGRRGVELVALVPARTDTRWWRDVATAAVVCFWRGRIKFVGADHSAPFPNAVAYWGRRPAEFCRVFGPRGWCVREIVAPDAILSPAESLFSGLGVSSVAGDAP